MKKKAVTLEQDIRIKVRRFSLKQFLIAFIILGWLALTQTQIMDAFLDKASMRHGWMYLAAMASFWAIVAAIYNILQHWQIRRNFARPLQKISEAAQKVAQGDFSVYLAPEHKPNKQDYVDITYENFNSMIKELSSIETLKSSFIADVSHELKTPLSVIQNYGEALMEPQLSETERLEYAQTVVEATERLTTLITNILKLNKLENQVLVSEMRIFDLYHQLCDCIFTFATKFEEKGIVFEAHMEDTFNIYSDESMLSIVWQNLFSNAIKFTEPNGKITLTQKQTDQYVYVTVTDDGCGMNEETMKRIFDKFYQGDRSHATEGNGLGLALCLKVIHLVGGEIKVDSEPGKGSSFTVILPKKNKHSIRKDISS